MLISTTSLLASLLTLAAAEPATAGGSAAPSPSVRIYRCADSNGQIALRDAPCLQGRQQVLDMVRPKDPPPREPLLTVRPTPAAADAAPPPRVIVVHSQPLFECTTPEGERYTADDGQGNPRWVEGPLVPVFIAAPTHHAGPPPHRPSAGRPGHGHGPGPGRPVVGTYVASGGQWVRDTCQQLGRQEACSVLGEQRWALISRYNSALSSEREQLVREQRRVEQRMQQQPCEG
ncbi:hypothetical protein ABB30_08440 [Stenotrophomonas ginsengisoli]|uniref:DUF4124 domain-containing protein n=1 Tax=Stenotrophomonas ginsengisoli TaxID=336566 RepID=A0A0R0D4D8_9GAMM|nr:hypothetical protein [Stenotrophomonas ginsengisoli]KRG76991.1 hypothetical protein ABB30_08440 [Stenotrophomonas ginsengisoli]